MPSLFPDLFAFRELAPLALRLVLAAVFVMHGYKKLFGNFSGAAEFFESEGIRPAKFWVSAVGAVEFFGGLLLAAGVLTQLLALLLAFDMAVAILKVKRRQGFTGGYEFELLLFAALISLLVLGPGAYSIDLPF